MKVVTYVVCSIMLFAAASVFAAGCGRKDSPAPSANTGAADAEIAQKTCPIMGEPIDKNIYLDHEGRRVYFCCSMCKDTFKKDPEKYIKKLDAEFQAAPEAEHEGHEH